MTRDEWARKLIVKMASGHTNCVQMNEAKDYLAGKEPPLPDDWEPKAKKKFEENKVAGSWSEGARMGEERKKKLLTVKEVTEAKEKNGPIGDEVLE